MQKTNTSEAYSEPSQTSNMKFFTEIVNNLRTFEWVLNTLALV